MLLMTWKFLCNMTATTTIKRGVSNGVKRQCKKEKFQCVPSVIDMIAIGHGYLGTPACFIVSTSHFKYMFNCGEGTQRMATEHKKLRGTDKIFFTGSSWKNVGGLIGTTLTLETAGVKDLFIFGPPGINHHMASSRSFSKLEKIEIVVGDISKSFTDSSMAIDFIKIKKMEQTLLQHKRIKLSEDVQDDEDAVAYLCKPHAKPRNIDLEKCVKLDIPVRGAHLKELKEEKEVTLSELNITIKPDDVLLPKEPNDPFLIVECPSIDHLENLIKSPELLLYHGGEQKICLVVHFTNSLIMADSRYIDWMKGFGMATKHLVMNDLCSPLDTEAMHKVQACRNLVHSKIFPLLPYSIYPENHFMNSEGHLQIKNGNEDLVHYAKTNMKYKYRPHSQHPIEEDQCIVLDKDKYIKEALDDSQQTFMDNWGQKSKYLECKNASFDDPELVFLGTGSAVPNKYRNVSCILLNVGEGASMMLDCGENSCGQIYRFYGPEKGQDMLRKLKAVFVSHLHADHHLGLIGIAIERKKCLELNGQLCAEAEPLVVIAPEALKSWYSAINCDNIPINRLIDFIPAESLYNEHLDKPYTYSTFLDLFKFEQIKTVRVQHTQFPHGVVLKHQKGWKLVYSGDTMPSNELIRAGENCDLLIHEATFDNNRIIEAREKKHSTSDQAINVGREMKAKFVMLTHFSQRYDKVPLFSDNFSENVGVAFDNMMVKFSDLKILPSFMPAYNVIYEAEYREMLQCLENKQHRLGLAKEFE